MVRFCPEVVRICLEMLRMGFGVLNGCRFHGSFFPEIRWLWFVFVLKWFVFVLKRGDGVIGNVALTAERVHVFFFFACRFSFFCVPFFFLFLSFLAFTLSFLGSPSGLNPKL